MSQEEFGFVKCLKCMLIGEGITTSLATQYKGASLSNSSRISDHPPAPRPAIEDMLEQAQHAASFLKAISHEGRRQILCHLASGEKSVTLLETLLAARQSAVSQQLSRLRLEGCVAPRPEGKTIYYRLADKRPQKVMGVVFAMFCLQHDTNQR